MCVYQKERKKIPPLAREGGVFRKADNMKVKTQAGFYVVFGTDARDSKQGSSWLQAGL